MKRSIMRWSGVLTWRILLGWGLAVLLVAVVAVYAVRGLGHDSGPLRLTVYGFSTQEESFTQGIFPAFEEKWKAETGRDLTLEGVFGASGTLAGQINLGAPADVAILSNAEHVTWLKIGGKVKKDAEPTIFGCTPMVVAVRPGNPMHVVTYADLARPGLVLLHPNPHSSGAGEWGVLAEYGSAFLSAHDPAAGEAQLQAIWNNVRVMPVSARAAMNLFELGAGDALVTYEQDALVAQQNGADLEMINPPRTIVAEHAAVIVDGNVTHSERPAAEAFLAFLLSPEGQDILARYHLRSPTCQGEGFSVLVEPFSVDELGGWSSAYAHLVENLWQTKIEPGLTLEPAP